MAQINPELDESCISCEVDWDNYKCPKSKRSCGHHCNHTWTADKCCWCGAITSGDPIPERTPESVVNEVMERLKRTK